MAYDRRGVHSPGVGEALRLVWPGRHCPGNCRDLSQELCSHVPSAAAPHPWWLHSPVHSGCSHLTMMTMTTTVITVRAPAFPGLILACRHPHMGTLVELTEQVAPTRPLPYFTGVPSVYPLTPRSHPVALSAWLQMTTRNVAHC